MVKPNQACQSEKKFQRDEKQETFQSITASRPQLQESLFYLWPSESNPREENMPHYA